MKIGYSRSNLILIRVKRRNTMLYQETKIFFSWLSPRYYSKFFLVVNTQLYKRVCPSIHPLVGRSISPSEMLFLSGQKQRWQKTYAVYLALFIKTLSPNPRTLNHRIHVQDCIRTLKTLFYLAFHLLSSVALFYNNSPEWQNAFLIV